jgi:hypothetical protein
VQVTAAPALNFLVRSIGRNLQVSQTVTLGAPAPAGGVNVTLTSADPSRLLISTSPTTAGSASMTLPVAAGGTSTAPVYLQALAGIGNVGVNVSAPGYRSRDANMNTFESGFVIVAPAAIATNVVAANTPVTIGARRLGFFGVVEDEQSIRGGFTVSVPVTSSNPSVGVLVPSSVTIAGGQSSGQTDFDPVGAGSTTLTAGVPADFGAPASGRQITATVSTALIVESPTIGRDLQEQITVQLAPAPAAPTTITVTSNDPTRLLLATSSTAAGQASVTLSVAAGSTAPSTLLYFHALDGAGTATVNFAAPGYPAAQSTVTLTPSGFVFDASSAINTVVSPLALNLAIRSVRLDPAPPNVARVFQPLRPGVEADVAVSSSNAAVGEIFPNAVRVSSAGVGFAQFAAYAPGSTTIALVTPAGFTRPGNLFNVVITVR